MNQYALAIALAVASTESSRAVGFLLPNQDPEAIGRGDAFAATADDPAAIYYNPAGITQLPGMQVSLGMYVISAYTSYTSPSGAKAHTDPFPQFVPQVYAVDTLKNLPLSFGLGIYAPYGLAISWGQDPQFSSIAQKGHLTFITGNPVVAWKVNKMLSVSVGGTVNYGDASFQNTLQTTTFPFFPPGYYFKFIGDDFAPGYTAGILFQPLPKWSFGINYHSETIMRFSGHAEQTFPFYGPSVDATAKIDFPQTIVGGISFRPTPKWNLEFDLNWTQWSKLGTITINNTPFGAPQPVPLNFRDSFIYDFGVTRQLGKGYYASVGYIYSENSSPDGNFNPLIPDADLNLGNFGFGHKGEHLDWAVAYQFAYNGGRHVTTDSNPIANANGTYKTFNNAVNASVTLKF